MKKESCKDDKHLKQHSKVIEVYGTVVYLKIVCSGCGKTIKKVIEV
ncbi:hypothetical protein [Myroides odoratimimus]|nr:hypothetical protein [Myroides odoratimimus]MDM1093404.1 hypothetical protein [Myroides odoratimimus]